MLRFQNLDSYRLAIQFVSLALQLIRALPRGHADDADQLRRGAKSIARNIAEGAGRSSPADKAHHYTVARGEAMECACSLDVMSAEGVVTPAEHEHGLELLTRIVAILTKSILNLRKQLGLESIDHDENGHHHHHGHDHGPEPEQTQEAKSHDTE